MMKLATLFVLMAWVWPGAAQSTPSTPQIEIVATTTQTADLVTVLLGDLVGETVTVTALMGAGVDPHLYKPTESDISAMSRAQAVFYSGLHLEGQFDAVFNALRERGVLTYAVSAPVKAEGYTLGGFDLSEELVNVDDPHFWFDPRNWELAAQGTAQALITLLPDHAETIEANTVEYIAQLQTLYTWASDAMSRVPESQRVLITSHDAFNYFGDAFGWEVHGLQGLSTQDEAGVADIQALARFVAERDIPMLFVESSVPPQAINAVREAVIANGGTVSISPYALYSDAMDAPDTFGGTYIGMMAHNVIAIVTGFGYETPPWPADLLPALPDDLFSPETEG
jgi:manganese/zinc/iron transport system substrate-binding protein